MNSGLSYLTTAVLKNGERHCAGCRSAICHQPIDRLQLVMANSCIITGPKLNKQQAKKVGSQPAFQLPSQAGSKAGRQVGSKIGRQAGRPEQARVDTYRRQEKFHRLDDQSH